MANVYWVGNSGNWSDNTNHWSSSSGGAPGAALPTFSDAVFFDTNSLTGLSRTVSINTTAQCGSLDFTGCKGPPQVARVAGGSLEVRGDLTLIGFMALDVQTGLTLNGSPCNFTPAGVNVNVGTSSLIAAGTLNLLGNLTTGGISVSGTLTTNNVAITAASLSGGVGAILNLGSSIINLTPLGSNAVVIDAATTVNAGTSAITLLGGSGINFIGADKTFYDLILPNNTTVISGANTFNSITVSAGKTVTFPGSGATTTIGTFTTSGTTGSNVIIQSSSGTANLCVTTWITSATKFININASCTGLVCCSCIDGGGNSNIDVCLGGAFLLSMFD